MMLSISFSRELLMSTLVLLVPLYMYFRRSSEKRKKRSLCLKKCVEKRQMYRTFQRDSTFSPNTVTTKYLDLRESKHATQISNPGDCECVHGHPGGPTPVIPSESTGTPED